MILAGGEGSRLEMLTEHRAKPAVPYAGVYRLIDFPLSNCMHSGVSDVWIVQQYEPQSLNDHISNGRPWDLDRTHGGLRLLYPHIGDEESGWLKGNADAIFRHRRLVEEMDPDVVVVLSSDHVYKLDYTKVVEHHLERAADVTIVTTEVPRERASRFGNVRTDDSGRVLDYAYKPEEPWGDLVATEVFAFDAKALMTALEDTAARNGDKDESLQDLGDELLPKMVKDGSAYAFRQPGYWVDVGTIESYWRSHMDLTRREPAIDLDDPSWPILTLGAQRPPARAFEAARFSDALLSPDCKVWGTVESSVLGPGVEVAKGALVRNSVVLDDVTIEEDAVVESAVVDIGVTVGAGSKVGRSRPVEETAGDDLVVLGAHARIDPSAAVEPGDRIPTA
jgi:glucose-1-phosphate adenylyltransferase